MKKIEIATELVNMKNCNRQLLGEDAYSEDEMLELADKAARINNKEALEKYLEDEVSLHSRLTEKAERERKTYNFEHSEEGRKAKDNLCNTINTLRENIYNELLSIVTNELGDGWNVYKFGNSSCEIGLKDSEGKMLWGYSFSVYYDYDLIKENEKIKTVFNFKVNIGSMGSFEVGAINNIQSFYIGVGKFLASEKVNTELKSELKQFVDNIYEARKAYAAKERAYIED